MSVSKVECAATIRGKGKFTLGLYRHLAPITVTALLDEFPIASRASIAPGMVTLLTPIKIGVEKQRLEFSKGDAAFLALMKGAVPMRSFAGQVGTATVWKLKESR